QLAALQPRTPQIVALLKQAQQDKTATVSLVAASALWPFHREAQSTQERAEWRDTQLRVETTIPLPLEGWRFKLDPRGTGHEQNWFASDLKETDWSNISIGKYWEVVADNYDGIAWYRGTLTLPQKPAAAFAGVDLVFDGVDESAWVWVNGDYVGQHDEGPAGYNKPFRMEVTEMLKWGQPNQITVRVFDRALGGGIWKPIKLEILKR
ncbi:MAG TPA: beta galactosidase jelly roll domain-containing protein, partial [Abditibacteriaceae bacterium]